MVLNVLRNHKTYYGRGGGGGGGGGGGEGGGRGGYGNGERGRLYTYHYTVTTRMTSALRWAAMRAILMLHNYEGKLHKTVSTDHNF